MLTGFPELEQTLPALFIHKGEATALGQIITGVTISTAPQQV